MICALQRTETCMHEFAPRRIQRATLYVGPERESESKELLSFSSCQATRYSCSNKYSLRLHADAERP